MSDAFLADTFNTTFASLVVAYNTVVVSELHDLLASTGRHARLTRFTLW